MTTPNTEPIPATDAEIADFEWNGCMSRHGQGHKCDSCGAWFSDEARGELHKPGCDSLMIPKIKARIEQEREMRRELAKMLDAKLKSSPSPFLYGDALCKDTLARAAEMEADNAR